MTSIEKLALDLADSEKEVLVSIDDLTLTVRRSFQTDLAEHQIVEVSGRIPLNLDPLQFFHVMDKTLLLMRGHSIREESLRTQLIEKLQEMNLTLNEVKNTKRSLELRFGELDSLETRLTNLIEEEIKSGKSD